MSFEESLSRAQLAYDNMSDEDNYSICRYTPSSKCVPKSSKCPFFHWYEEEPEKTFCEGCQYLERASKYDSGNKRSGYLMAYICSKDAMNPEIYEIEPEPFMKWE